MLKTNVASAICIITLLFFVSCTESENIKLSLNSLFSDHMVLQQQEEVAVWGESNPMAKISVSGSWGQAVSGAADASGNWQLKLPTPKAGGPFQVHITTEDQTITLKDVLIGEVWLASGQSNMEMPLEGFLPKEPVDNYQKEVANANYDQIRYFDVTRAIEASPVNKQIGKWTVTNATNANKFSATGYFFARRLHKELGVPVGVITSTWGGTPVESWMSKEKIKSLAEFPETLETLKEENISIFTDWYAKFISKKTPATLEEWASIDLEDASFSKSEFDDSDWKTAATAAKVEDLPIILADGVYWFRKTILLNDISSDYTINIAEGIDDMDDFFVNGKKIGSTFGHNTPRSYTIPKSILTEGENNFTFRVIDTGGGGGFMSEINLINNTSTEKNNISEDWHFKQTAGIQGSKLFQFHKNQEALENPPAGIESYSLNAHTPTVLYNGMIHPLIPYNIKGAIWYQGESNVGRDEQYLKLFPGMIEDWRARWESDFSFYFVQIAPFTYGNELSPALRDAQRKSLVTPKTGMAITMDIGLSKSIHPGNKQDVGRRLAQLALANDYDKNFVASGPLYKEHRIDGNKMYLEFDYSGSGLMTKNSDLLGFEIAGEDKKYHPATASIKGNTIEVSAIGILEPKYARYAWKDFIIGTLYNQEGLPASSFTTE